MRFSLGVPQGFAQLHSGRANKRAFFIIGRPTILHCVQNDGDGRKVTPKATEEQGEIDGRFQISDVRRG